MFPISGRESGCTAGTPFTVPRVVVSFAVLSCSFCRVALFFFAGLSCPFCSIAPFFFDRAIPFSFAGLFPSFLQDSPVSLYKILLFVQHLLSENVQSVRKRTPSFSSFMLSFSRLRFWHGFRK